MRYKSSTGLFVLLALHVAGAPLFAGDAKTAVKLQSTIFVQAKYPGANAGNVAESVAAPIEQKINVGVKNVIQMASRCGNDGSYTLAITFKPGTDLDKAQMLVQNCVALAEPILPEEVKRFGVTTRKKSPIRMLISLTCTDDSRDVLYLSNYATMHLKDQLARVAGVGEITVFGQRDYSLRIWLDPEKIAARKLSVADVLKALREQNVQIQPGRIGQAPAPGQEFQYKLGTLGRLTDPEQFETLILKTDDKGRPVRVKDVARLELSAGATDGYVTINGKPGVMLGVYPIGGTKPREFSRAVADEVARLRAKGLRLEIDFDFTANLEMRVGPGADEFLVIDLQMPDAASLERIRATLERCDKLLRGVAGVRDVLTLTENPFDFMRNGPCVVVRLVPTDKRKSSRDEILQKVRAELNQVKEGSLRIRDLSRLGRYPIEFAIGGPDAEKVRVLAHTLTEKLQASKKLDDVSLNRDSWPQPTLSLRVDRDQALALGVSLQEVFDTLQVYLGSAYVSDFNRFGRSWQVVVQADAKLRGSAEDLKKLKVRNNKGEMILLGNVINAQERTTPAVVHRLNLWPMVQVTANLAADVPLAQGRAVCESLFEQIRKEARLSTEYRLTWMQ